MIMTIIVMIHIYIYCYGGKMSQKSAAFLLRMKQKSGTSCMHQVYYFLYSLVSLQQENRNR